MRPVRIASLTLLRCSDLKDVCFFCSNFGCLSSSPSSPDRLVLVLKFSMRKSKVSNMLLGCSALNEIISRIMSPSRAHCDPGDSISWGSLSSWSLSLFLLLFFKTLVLENPVEHGERKLLTSSDWKRLEPELLRELRDLLLIGD